MTKQQRRGVAMGLAARLSAIATQRQEATAQAEREREARRTKDRVKAAPRIAAQRQWIEAAVVAAAERGECRWEEEVRFDERSPGARSQPGELTDRIAAVAELRTAEPALVFDELVQHVGNDDYDRPITPHWYYRLRVTW